MMQNVGVTTSVQVVWLHVQAIRKKQQAHKQLLQVKVLQQHLHQHLHQ
jgi:hypothetical protein